MSNLDLFLNTYKIELKRSRIANPDMYAWPIAELEEVFKRMRDTIQHGSFNKDSYAFKATCKALKIKHTYRDIESFIHAK